MVAVTGGDADGGDTVPSELDDFVVSPVVISVVAGAVNVPGSDTIDPRDSSDSAAVTVPMATTAQPPATADRTFHREPGFGLFDSISRHSRSV